MGNNASRRRGIAWLVASAVGGAASLTLFGGVAQAVLADIVASPVHPSVDTLVTIPADVCAVSWTVVGGSGGSIGGSPGTGGYGGAVQVQTAVHSGDQLLVQPGVMGGWDIPGSAVAGGRSGSTASGGGAFNRGGGGGGASIVRSGATTSSPALIIAGGGGGAAPGANGGDAGATGSAGANFVGGPGTYAGGGGATASAGGAAGTVPAGDLTAVAGTAGAELIGGAAPNGGSGGGGGGRYGGGSGGSQSSSSGAAGGGGSNLAPTGATLNGTTGTYGDGSVLGLYSYCPAPTAPALTAAEPGNGSAVLTFTAGASTGTTVTGWQYSTDGGTAWTALATTAAAGGARAGTVTGLINGTATSVVLRATSAQGPSPASNALSVTASGTPGSPRSVTALPDQSALLVSWQPPASGAAASGYRVTASPGSATCTTTGLSCLLGGVAGTTYTVTVTAVGADGTAGAGTSVTTTAAVGEPTVPAVVPTTGLTLTTDQGVLDRVGSGQRLTVIGTGFLPWSTATIVIYSTPTVLGTVTTDASGGFSAPVTVPVGLAAGQHSLVASGIAPDGTDRFLRMDVTVAAAVTGDAPALAYTGFTPAPYLLTGGLALLTGAGLLVGLRRRRA